MIQFSTFNKIVQPEECTNEYEITYQQVSMTESSYTMYTVDSVFIAVVLFSRYSRRFKHRKFKNMQYKSHR